MYLLDWYGLTTIGGDLTIMDNPSLQEVLIYELQSINGSINIQMITPDPYDSNSIDLTALERVGGDFNITGPLISLSEDPAGYVIVLLPRFLVEGFPFGPDFC